MGLIKRYKEPFGSKAVKVSGISHSTLQCFGTASSQMFQSLLSMLLVLSTCMSLLMQRVFPFTILCSL